MRHFTLIELICVMVLLATIMGLAAPALSRFFHARSVTDEARRFLALTGYARRQAVARGWPVRLWLRYGLEPLPGVPSESDRTLEFQVMDGVGLTVGSAPAAPAARPAILFLPDGSIGKDDVQSLTLFGLRDQGNTIRVSRATDGPRYVVAQ